MRGPRCSLWEARLRDPGHDAVVDRVAGREMRMCGGFEVWRLWAWVEWVGGRECWDQGV